MDAYLVLTNEVEVDDVGQDAIVILQDHVELAMRVWLVPASQLVLQSPHRRLEIISPALKVLIDDLVCNRNSNDVIHAKIP